MKITTPVTKKTTPVIKKITGFIKKMTRALKIITQTLPLRELSRLKPPIKYRKNARLTQTSNGFLKGFAK
jgi:hypothetical protein